MSGDRKTLTHSKVCDSIKKLLAEECTDYQVYEHTPVYTSEEAANIRKVDMSMGAKAIVFYADKKPVLVVVPGDKKVNVKNFKALVHVKDLRIASPEEVTELTGLYIGAIPPMGSIMGLHSYYDVELVNKVKVAFNAGAHTVSVIMSAAELVRLEKPTVGNYAI